MSPRLSIVIPGAEPGLRQTKLVQSCFQQNLSPNDFEVIFVTPSTSTSEKIYFPELSSLIILTVPQNNVSLARNTGASVARGKYVLLLDDDIHLASPNFFRDALDLAATIKPPFILGGAYLSNNNVSLVAATANTLTNLWIQSGIQNCDSVSEAQYLPGGVLLAPKDIFSVVSFPNEIPWGGEDSVFIMRAQDAGIKTYYSASLDVIHLSSPSLFKFIRRSWYSGRAQGAFKVSTASAKKKVSALRKHSFKTLLAQFHLISLHFLVLMAAKLFYKALRHIPENKK